MGKAKPDPDPYMSKVDEQWDAITGMYLAFEEYSPIIEFDVVKRQILSYPANAYIETLTERTREQTREMYEQATAEGKLMLFVRDASKQVLRSYIFPRAEG